jgi:hypothetical protein
MFLTASGIERAMYRMYREGRSTCIGAREMIGRPVAKSGEVKGARPSRSESVGKAPDCRER